MSIKKFTTSAIVAAGLIAANLAPVAATSASAKDWRRYDDRGYARSYDGHRHYHGPRHRYAKRHRDNRGKDIAKGVAIGLGVLAVGAILSSAHR